MFQNIKSKIIFIGAIILIIVGIIYQIKQKNQENMEIDYQNIVVQEDENIDEKQDTLEEKEYIKIHIAGQVKNTGIIELEVGSRISDAIQKAGGITEFANLEEVNLAYSLEDGQKLYIPSIEEKNVEYITKENGENIIQVTNIVNSKNVININKANIEELESIPGVGPSMAQKIINYRIENGNFKTIEDLKNVSGIGDKKFESMKDYVCVK